MQRTFAFFQEKVVGLQGGKADEDLILIREDGRGRAEKGQESYHSRKFWRKFWFLSFLS